MTSHNPNTQSKSGEKNKNSDFVIYHPSIIWVSKTLLFYFHRYSGMGVDIKEVNGNLKSLYITKEGAYSSAIKKIPRHLKSRRPRHGSVTKHRQGTSWRDDAFWIGRETSL